MGTVPAVGLVSVYVTISTVCPAVRVIVAEVATDFLEPVVPQAVSL